MELGSVLSLLVLLLTLSAIAIRKFKLERKGKRSQLPGPLNLPFVGCIHHLFSNQPVHRILNRLSSTYGPIMRLKLGEINVAVISTADGAREIMKTHDLTFASRPITLANKMITYGCKDIVFSPYGEYWHQMRRLCALELFSTKRIRSFRSIREEEISSMIRSLADEKVPTVVDFSKMISQVNNNITARAVVGGKMANLDLFLSATARTSELATGLTISDIFPSIPFLASITGLNRKLEQLHQNIDFLTEEIIREHEKTRDDSFAEEDITDVLLRVKKDGTFQFPFTNDHIKAVILNLLMGGTETTIITMEWAMSELIQNPTVMRKVQKEVREVFGGNNMTKIIADENLINEQNLSYLHSVIKETLRMHPPLPLVIPRQNCERCEVMGYEIPSKTMVLINAWMIGRDPKYWDEPNVFRPERFLKSDIDFRGGNYEYIPFGAGRRICPGMQFGIAALEIALAHVLYYFDWEHLTKQLDMSEAPGLSVKRMSPLYLLCTPRIPIP